MKLERQLLINRELEQQLDQQGMKLEQHYWSTNIDSGEWS